VKEKAQQRTIAQYRDRGEKTTVHLRKSADQNLQRLYKETPQTGTCLTHTKDLRAFVTTGVWFCGADFTKQLLQHPLQRVVVGGAKDLLWISEEEEEEEKEE
jgi:hypothetical protein